VRAATAAEESVMFGSVGSPLLWAGFVAFVLVLLALDLFVLHRKPHAVRTGEALAWVGVYVSLALLFCGGIYWRMGSDRALEFLAGYVIEEALSVDNLFVFLLIFSYFRIEARFQHRVLVWGVTGALVLRALFVLVGAALIHTFHWITYVFGAFLVVTGAKMLFQRGEGVNIEHSPVLRLLRRWLPITDDRSGRFLVTHEGRTSATPLLLVLLLIEATDVIFAVDSIPAVFAVTADPFIVFTSNIFAILGLRSLYFALAGMMARFRHLKTGLSLVLAFVGTKMLVARWYHIPVGWSLGAIALILAAAVVASLFHRPTDRPPTRSLEPRDSRA
jgi:tellurite resistance protein TerC